MKKHVTAVVVALLCALSVHGQGARNIKINEVMTANRTSLTDGYGVRGPWIELVNTSYSTYNVRNMFITTDRRVLDKSLTAPQRMAMMSMLPSGDDRTNMSARQHLLLNLNSSPAKGSLYLSAKLQPGQPVWIALYDGNGIDIIDSVSVPALAVDCSYARVKDGGDTWAVVSPENVTPGIDNYLQADESKVAKIKRDDPYGIGISVLSMGIVFFCLALLYVFFRLLGVFMAHKQALKKAGNVQPIKAAVKTGELIAETGHRTKVILKDGLQTGGIDKEVYIAVIAMALRQYEDDVHDIESNVITIKPHQTNWGAHTGDNHII